MKTLTKLLPLVTLLASAAVAQDIPADEPEEEIRRYTVEVIIFSYAQNVSSGSEIFVADAPPPELQDRQVGANQRVYELVMLAREDFQLVNIAERLERLGAYKPLLHFGWTQSTYPEDDTQARPLSSFVTPPAGLEGKLKLYLSRYLHLAIDLALDAPHTSAAISATSRNSLQTSYNGYGDSAVSNQIRYRIKEDRIFRNGELRYFDHPKFGVLAKITRVEKESQQSPGNVTTNREMLGD